MSDLKTLADSFDPDLDQRLDEYSFGTCSAEELWGSPDSCFLIGLQMGMNRMCGRIKKVTDVP